MTRSASPRMLLGRPIHEKEPATFALSLPLNFAIGASVALAGRGALPHERFFASSALWALLLLEALVMVPQAALYLLRYPDWSLGYWTSGELSWPLLAALLLCAPVLALAGFVLTRRLILTARLGPAFGILVSSLLITLALGFVLREGLGGVGPQAAYLQKSAALRPFAQTQLAFLVAGGLAILSVSLGATLWRLHLVSAASNRPPNKPEDPKASNKTMPPKRRPKS